MPILYSDNKLFAVNTKTQSILYSKNAKHGLPLRLVGPPQDGYYPYTYAYEFGNDCLQFAESLVTRVSSKTKRQMFFSVYRMLKTNESHERPP